MDVYSAQAFIQVFIRFSCKVGYSKRMAIDESCHLIKYYLQI